MKMASRFMRRVAVRFDDVDYARILYLPRQIHYLLIVLEQYIVEELGLPIKEMFDEQHLSMPTVNINVDFKRPLQFGEVAEISLWVERIGDTSITFAYEAANAATQELTCTARHTVVMVDDRNMRPLTVPQDYRRALSPFLAETPSR
jgi:YbgC/YbaW family acyl-CoA thioester hydrolase